MGDEIQSGIDGNDTARCEFIGGFRMYDSSGAEVSFPIIKGAAIIAHLSLQNGHQASRSELTGLLWGDKPEAAARTALRQCLHQMRARLSKIKPPFLSTTLNTVKLDPGNLPSDIDVLTGAKPLPKTMQPGQIDPYQFLYGFEDLDPAFSEWLWNTRTQLDEGFRSRLKAILNDPATEQAERLAAAHHLHALDPSQEIAARLLIEHAVREGDMVTLLRVYKKLCDALDEEWGEEPSGDLQQLVGNARAKFGDVTADFTASATDAPVRKYLTILTLQSGRQDGDATTIGERLNLAEEAIGTRGGALIRRDSDALCAAFGLGLSSENSARDGIEVALELREILGEDANFGIGLETGYLLVEPFTDAAQKQKVTGGALAQSLTLASQRDRQGFSITTTAKVLRGLERYYLTDPDPAAAIPAVRITGRTTPAQQSAMSGKQETFVGRAPFLAALWELWTETLDGEGVQIASIQGPAGVGKTRLADEFLTRISEEGVFTLRAACNRYDRSAPLEPLIALMRELNSRLGKQPPADAAQQPGFTTETLVSELGSALKDCPAAIFIDDWQWADDATRQAIGRIISSTGDDTQALLVLTSRNAPSDEWLAAFSQQIVLPSLTAREVVEKAELLLSRPIDGRLKQQLLVKSGGNPLFLEEVCHALRQSALGHNLNGKIADLPANVQTLFATRFEKLAQDDRAIVFAAAAYGDQVDLALLSNVLGFLVPQTVLDRLSADDVLVVSRSGDAIRFKHGLARDVAYNMIPEDRRRALHLAYAGCLQAAAESGDQTSAVEQLALHYRGAGDLANAAKYAELSGDKALKASSHDQAIWHFGLALDLLDQLPMDEAAQRRWVSLAIRWAIPMTYTPSYEQLHILERAEKIARQVDDRYSAAALRYWIGYFGYVLGDKSKPLDDLRRARDLAVEVGDDRQAIEAKAVESCLLGSIARYDQAERLMRETIAIKDRNPSKKKRVPVTSVYTRANLAMLRADRGHFDEADDLITEALQRVGGFEHEVESSILLFAGTINIWRGDWEAAIDDAKRSRNRSDKVSSPYLMGMSRCIWGYAYWRQCGAAAGLDSLARNARYMQERDLGMFSSFIFGWLADAMATAGRWKETAAACHGAEERASKGEICGAAMASRAASRRAIAERRLDDAARHLAEAMDYAARRDAPHEIAANHLMNARLLHACDRQADGFAEIETGKSLLAELGLTRRVAMASALAAELSET